MINGDEKLILKSYIPFIIVLKNIETTIERKLLYSSQHEQLT